MISEMTHSAREAQVALLVDFDNIWFGVNGRGIPGVNPNHIAEVLWAVAARSGTVAIARVHTAAARPELGGTFESKGFNICVADNPRKGTDTEMTLFGMEVLLSRPEITTYVLASGDADFVPLAKAIVIRNKLLVVIAPRMVVHPALADGAHQVIILEDVLRNHATTLPPPPSDRVATSVRWGRPATTPRIRVFLCHSRFDKPTVRKLYRRLLREDGITPWLDEVDLVAGQDWELTITKQVRESHCVLVCLSRGALDRSGYVHKEIRSALDVADRQPEGTIFLIPVKLEVCDVPERLRRFQWVDLFASDGFPRLLRALRTRAQSFQS